MLKVTAIKKSYGATPILRGVSFLALPNQLTILEGKNGAGKSTFFSIIAGSTLPDHGDITLNERSLNKTSAQQRAQTIALLKQDPKACSVSSLSVLENLALAGLKGKTCGLKNATSPSTHQRIMQHLTDLDITFLNDLSRPMGLLSGGQRQIIAFAMATLVPPALLLLDEPTAALDEHSSHLLMTMVKRFIATHHIPAVMISHDHDLNQKYGDKIYVLEQGGIVER